MTADRRPTSAGPAGSADLEPDAWAGLSRAQWYAARAGRAIGTEHLLLALTDGEPGPVRDALDAAGVTTDAVVRVLRAIQGPTLGPGRPGSPPRSDRARAVLARAAAAAPGDRPDDRHVLAALVDDPDPALAHLVLVHLEARRTLLRTVAAADWSNSRSDGRADGGTGGAAPR